MDRMIAVIGGSGDWGLTSVISSQARDPSSQQAPLGNPTSPFGNMDPSLPLGISEKTEPRTPCDLFHNFQLVRGQDLLDLVSGVDGPGAHGVKLGVSLPVAEGAAGLAGLLIG